MRPDLRQIRQRNDLTQVEAARGVGVSLGTYRLWELGAGQPNPENLEKLVSLFGDDVFAALKK